MSDTCRGGEVAPFTFAALDEWDKTQLLASLNRRRQERESQEPPHVQGFIDIRPEVAAIDGLLAARIQEHSESDQVQQDPEGEQS